MHHHVAQLAESRSSRSGLLLANGHRNTTGRSKYTSYKVANLPIEFSTSIPRTQLRPGYGDGFLGAPLQRVPPHESPSPRAQGGQRGTSRTRPQSNPGGTPHV